MDQDERNEFCEKFFQKLEASYSGLAYSMLDYSSVMKIGHQALDGVVTHIATLQVSDLISQYEFVDAQVRKVCDRVCV